MKRAFTHGTSASGKLVVIEVNGPRVVVTQKKSDGSTKKSERDLRSETEAHTVCEGMVRELIAQGFVERPLFASTKSKSARPAPAASKPVAKAAVPEKINVNYLFEDDEQSPGSDGPVLPRLAAAPGAGPAADSAPKKKKAGGKKKKRKKAERGDALDKRVIAGILAVGALGVALAGLFVYDAFLKPPTIVGTWAGSMIDYEIGRPIIHTQYRLLLDEKKRASLTLQEKFTSVGTYAVKGDRLTLTLKDVDDEKGEEGAGSERQYKFSLGRSTLDLFDPQSGKKMVQLLRFREAPAIGGGTKPPAAPTDLAAGAADQVDKGADARLASVEFSPKDGAFKLRHPQGWSAETGSRPDNTYSWASFTRGSAKIQVFADVQGSLMSGSDSAGQHEEGSELAPVHTAHTLYKKTVSKEYDDYNESNPTLFKGSQLGEGRISAFTASGGGLFGSKLRGYRATLLTNDRRVTVLCHCPEGDFEKLKPTFLAVCRSLSR
jgi:hypothetical protein